VKCPHVEFLNIGRSVLKDGNLLRFSVAGGSMRPLLFTGDIVTVKPCAPQDIRLGDIVFCRVARDRLCMHRVVKKRSSRKGLEFTLKGDAWFMAGNTVFAKDLLGKVVARERNGRVFSLDNPMSRSLSLLFIPVSYVLPLLFRCARFARLFFLFLVKRILLFLQGFKAYRSRAKRRMRAHVSISTAPYENAGPQDVIIISAMYKKRVVGRLSVGRLEGGPADIWWVTGLSVDWFYRGMDIGRKLMDAACNAAAGRGASYVRLHVFEKNPINMIFYGKLGFSRIIIPELEESLQREAEKTKERRVVLEKKL